MIKNSRHCIKIDPSGRYNIVKFFYSGFFQQTFLSEMTVLIWILNVGNDIKFITFRKSNPALNSGPKFPSVTLPYLPAATFVLKQFLLYCIL